MKLATTVFSVCMIMSLNGAWADHTSHHGKGEKAHNCKEHHKDGKTCEHHKAGHDCKAHHKDGKACDHHKEVSKAPEVKETKVK